MKWCSGENLPVTHARPAFSEAWFHQHYGLDFGERYYTDPIFRTEQDREALRLVHERFGALGAEAFLCLAEPSEEFRMFLRMIADLCLETYDQLALSFNPHLDLMINIPALQAMPRDHLRETLREMVSQAAPRALLRDIFMADIGPVI